MSLIECKNCMFNEICHQVTDEPKKCAMFAPNPNQEVSDIEEDTQEETYLTEMCPEENLGNYENQN